MYNKCDITKEQIRPIPNILTP